MIISLSKSTLESLIQAELIDVERFSRCQIEECIGSFTDARGNQVIRVQIYVPGGRARSGAEMLDEIHKEDSERTTRFTATLEAKKLETAKKAKALAAGGDDLPF